MRCAVLLLALSMGAVGCTDDDIALVIKHLAAVKLPDCTADPAGEFAQSRGILDVGMSQFALRGYTIAPVVTNNLLVPAGAGTTPETNTVTLTGFDVQLIAAPNDVEAQQALAQVPSEFFVPLTGGRIPPGGASSVAVFLEVVPRDVARALGTTIANTGVRSVGPLMAHFRPVGQRAGAKINGGYTDFPIDVCKFCLSPPPTTCPTGGFDPVTVATGGCFLQQDASITCCTMGGGLRCGSAVPMAKP